MSGGVFITFGDGKCAFYSASLLHVTLPQAEEFKEKYQEKVSEPPPPGYLTWN